MTNKNTLIQQEAERLCSEFLKRMEELTQLVEDKTPWVPLTIPPITSGKYLVGHRGHQEMKHYLTDDKEWFPGTKLGWQGDMSFNPTHWMTTPTIEFRRIRSHE